MDSLRVSADEARRAYDNETAIHYYTLALQYAASQPGLLDAAGTYELLAGREVCHGLLGQYLEQQADLDEMSRLAKELDDPARQVRVVNSQVMLDNVLGNYIEAQYIAKSALALARSIQDRALEADCLTSLGVTFNSLGDYARTQACHEHALRIRRELGDRRGEALSLRRLGYCLTDTGETVLALEYIEQSYEIYRSLGDLQGQADSLNSLGIITKDKARARSYYEQSLGLYETIGDQIGQANLLNNLALVYWNLGIYTKARQYIEKAVHSARRLLGRSSLASFLESLGRVYVELEEYQRAREALEEGRSLSREIGDRLSETTYLMMLGRVAFAGGEYAQARELFQSACDMQREMGTQGYLVTSLAWLGTCCLALGDWMAAEEFTREAVVQVGQVGRVSEYPLQDVWWLRYKVLAAPERRTLGEDPAPDPETFECLWRAHQALLDGIETLSDDGLRRNYLNKVKINREILFEWARLVEANQGAGAKDQAEKIFQAVQGSASPPERMRDRLKRLLDISLQMNSTLNPETLLDFVMDNLIELCGAERGFLALVSGDGSLESQVERGLGLRDLRSTGSGPAKESIDKALLSRMPVLLEDTAQDDPILLRRSVLCLPLLRHSELQGLIYLDTPVLSGRFSTSDVDFLSIFASQAATAIENARLFGERERRITELSILDEIGRLLSSTLDLNELLETVHQQVGRMFDATNFYIATYQEGDSEWTSAFRVENGVRQPVQRRKLGLGLTGYILRNREPILICSGAESHNFKAAHGIPPVGDQAKSWMGVPLIAADRVVGVMAIQSYEQENLYDFQALNLFLTIASQVAIAIRNTRLYDEISRANRELESFSYSVSHDLRAPLRAINGFSHVLLEDHAGQLDANGQAYLKRIGDASHHMGQLIDDMLRLSRVTRAEIHRQPVDLSDLARSILADFCGAHPGRRVEVSVMPGLLVNADPNLMRILLQNLLGNAWKFTQKQVNVKIEFGAIKKDEHQVYYVRDNGAGFDMAYVDKLFGAFQRLHDAAEFEGTGIGLATVQRIIHRHGGLVWAEGAVGQGATFFFTLAG
jgi:signal transduction histidine kinase/uncharacterized protein HemY